MDLAYSVGVWARTLVAATTPGAKPLRADALAAGLPREGWRTVTWREGTNAPLKSRFQRVRVSAAGDGARSDEPTEWQLAEGPKGEKEPTKFWLSPLRSNTNRADGRYHDDALAH